jgi:hypothetical protein
MPRNRRAPRILLRGDPDGQTRAHRADRRRARRSTARSSAASCAPRGCARGCGSRGRRSRSGSSAGRSAVERRTPPAPPPLPPPVPGSFRALLARRSEEEEASWASSGSSATAASSGACAGASRGATAPRCSAASATRRPPTPSCGAASAPARSRCWTRQGDARGVLDARPCDLRHSFVSLLIAVGPRHRRGRPPGRPLAEDGARHLRAHLRRVRPRRARQRRRPHPSGARGDAPSLASADALRHRMSAPTGYASVHLPCSRSGGLTSHVVHERDGLTLHAEHVLRHSLPPLG